MNGFQGLYDHIPQKVDFFRKEISPKMRTGTSANPYIPCFRTDTNYDAIEVSKTKDIPMDWDGAMGVPITFLDKYNPEQFEIVGMDRPLITQLTGKQSRFRVNGKEKFARIVIQNKKAKK